MKLTDLSLPLGTWFFHRVLVNHHKWFVQESVDMLKERSSCAGQGLIRVHITRSMVHNEAMCGAVLSSIGGPMRSADCFSCIRIAKRAGVWKP